MRSRRRPQPTILKDDDSASSNTKIECQPPDKPRGRITSVDTGKLSKDAASSRSLASWQLLERDTLSSTPVRQQKPSLDQQDNPLGLTVLYAPTSGQPSVDIIFIHGLGGTSLKTWCKNRDLDYLWPRDWLPREPELENARILTFGYHAHFARKEQVSLSINDFANDLLFRLKYDDSSLSDVPIIFVAHSLGGLVFKKAFIHANLNDEYKEVAARIKAVLFLATPHRGSDLAQTLSRVLKGSVFGHSRKEYVNELARNSPTINEINDSFRHHSRKLQIFSFYETVATPVGPVTTMIVDKASSVLGYEKEVQQALIANHHDVCKFSSPQESNYRAVCGALKSAVANAKLNTTNEDNELEILRSWLGASGPPEEDLFSLQATRTAGTCENFYRTEEFAKWTRSAKPCVLWVYAPPGSGKSVHCSLTVDNLMEDGARVAYWFFKYEDRSKRSIGNMLRSAAYQIAAEAPAFRRELVDLARSQIQVIRAEAAVAWRTIFEHHLHAIDKPHYLVVDGLDESDSTRTFIDLISRIGRTDCGLRVMVFSRPLSQITQEFRRAQKSTPVLELSLSNTLVDIRCVATEEMEFFISDDDGFKSEIIDEITSRSRGNFLWAALVLREIVSCLRHEDVRAALREIPDGMDKLYDRMAESIAKLSRPADRELCRILLSWALYSQRPVTLHELQGPYTSQLGAVINIQHTFDQFCGQFALVDQTGHISLIHQTAHDYLRATHILPFSLDPEGAHEEMLCLCLQSLCDRSLRGIIRQRRPPPFVDYASSCWSFHLDQCAVASDAVLNSLCHFFSGIYPLLWIQLLSMAGNLSLLVSASSSVVKYARSRRKVDSVKPPTLWRTEDLSLLETWATDLLKITAKYGSHLTGDPGCIFSCIPPVAPHNSAIFQTYSNKTANSISVTGVSNLDWDDCLARVSVVSGETRHLAVSPQHLAVANDSPSGCIQLWDRVIFQEYKMLAAGEPIFAITFSQSGALFACYGMDTTYVWKVGDGTITAQVPNPLRERAMALRFAPRERRVVIATDLRRVYHLDLDETPAGWCEFDSTLLEESSLPEDAFISSPSSVSFNADCSQLAVAYRSFPLAVWGLDPPELIARCRRRHKQGQTMNNTWTGVNRVVWHPYTGYVLGIYRDGNIFKWGPMDDSHEEAKQELDATPSEIACSPNGQVFATSDVKGTMKIYDYAQMVLIYKLTSEDLVTAITFSPDSSRLYDIRGASCNVWEPNCLVRLVGKSLEASEKSESVTTSDMGWDRKGSVASEIDEVRSITTLSLAASEAHTETRAPITTVSTCVGNQNVVAYANNEGTVVVKDLARDCTYEVSRSPFGMGVGQVVLSHDGKRVAYSMVNGRVTVKDLDFTSAAPRDRIKAAYSEKTSIQRGIMRQLLFHVGGHLLLVAGTEKVQILKMPSGETVASLDASEFQSIRHEMWATDASDPERLLAFSNEGCRGYSWQNLQPPDIPRIVHDDGHTNLDDQQYPVVESIQPCFHPKMTLALTSTERMGSKKFSFIIFHHTMGTSRADGDAPVTEVTVPDKLSQKVIHPVGILQDGRLVFLDSYLWVCTLPLRSIGTQTAPTRHFFIPRDWVNGSAIKLCSMLKDGTVLCSSKGELAIIKNDVEVGW